MTDTEHAADVRPRGWFKSTYSGGQNGCVEVNLDTPTAVLVRDSKLGEHSPVLAATAEQWCRFLAEVAGGYFSNDNGAMTVTTSPGRWEVASTDGRSGALVFNESEWHAFERGVAEEQFAV